MPAMPMLRRRSVLDLLTPTAAADSNANGKHADNEDEDGPRRPATATAALAPPPALSSGRSNSEYAVPLSRLSHEVLRSEVPDSPPIQEGNSRTKRFSMLKFRNYSESHLSARAKEDAKAAKERERQNAPPVPVTAVPCRSCLRAREMVEADRSSNWNADDRQDRTNFRRK